MCWASPAVEELAARDALIASLREENEALRVKVATLAEIAFRGSERRANKGGDADEELGERDDDSSGANGDLGAPGLVTDDRPDKVGDGATGKKRRRDQRRGADGHGRR